MLSTEHIFLYALFAVFLAGVHALSKQSLFPAGCWMLVSGTLYAWFAGPPGLAPPLPHLDHDLILHGFLPLLIFTAVRRFRLSTLRAVAPDALFLSTGGLLLAAVFFAAGMALLMVLTRALILFTAKATFHFTRWPLPLHWLPVLQLAGMKGAVSAALLMTLPLDDPHREFFLCAAYAMILFTFLTHPPLAAKVLRNL